MTTHALLWSQKQNALHIETVEQMLSNGRRAYAENRASDYIPLLIASLADVQAAAGAARHTLLDRDTTRARDWERAYA